MPLPFTKMHSLGNDFVMIDGVRNSLSITPEFARHIADRKFGIGCDQILIAESSNDTNIDFVFRIVNADGSESGQCGNGARCFARFLIDQGLTRKKSINVSTLNTQMTLNFENNDKVIVNMGQPVLEHSAIPYSGNNSNHIQSLCIYNEEREFGVLSMGNPHAVLLVDEIGTADVDTIGAAVERHVCFPQRTNVGFMQIVNQNEILLRVFERGVGETLACGSGACAAVVSGQLRKPFKQRGYCATPRWYTTSFMGRYQHSCISMR